MIRRTILPLLFGLIGTAILLGLGAWQVQRLEWKQEILTRIEARLAAEPVGLPETPTEAEHEYMRVELDGELLPGEVHVYTGLPGGGAGYHVIAPFETGGRRILIDRGLVPVDDKDAARPPGSLRIRGSLLWPDEAGRFTAEPDLEKNIWIAREVTAIADALGTEPVMVAVEASSRPAALIPAPVSLNIPNRHLGYAVTWFGLAVVWLGMTGYWIWRMGRPLA